MFAQAPPNNAAYLAGAIVGGLFAGAVSGLIPLLVGIAKKQVPLGVGGMVFCTLCGPVLGCLRPLPVALVFMTIILVTAPKAPPRDLDPDLSYFRRGREPPQGDVTTPP